mgnify:CR=1 FL=1
MIKRPDTRGQRIKRHNRVRGKISGTAERPRLCVFRSAREPEEQSLGALARLLCARHGYRAVTFEIVTDETLLGGFTAEIDGVTYDKSVRGQLRALAHDL